MDKWAELKDKHQGQTCLVVGNGPSLKLLTPRQLNLVTSFGANRCYMYNWLHRNDEPWQPSYYVSVNPLVLDQYLDEVRREVNAAAYFVAERFAAQLADFDTYPLHSIYAPVFSRKPWRGIYEGYTVTYVSLQLARFMGFATVLLVGVDHRFTAPEGTMPNQAIPGFEEGDPNHFHPGYFGAGSAWHMADLERSAEAYKLAREAFEDDGGRIINLTPGSALDVFEAGNLEEWL